MFKIKKLRRKLGRKLSKASRRNERRIALRSVGLDRRDLKNARLSDSEIEAFENDLIAANSAAGIVLLEAKLMERTLRAANDCE